MSATLDAATIRRLADMHAVYRLFDEAGCLLYVGMSGRTGRRFDDHAIKNWWPLVRTVTLEWHDTAAQAALAERYAINTEHPRYNKARPRLPKKPPKRARRPAARKLEPPAKPRRLLDDLDQVLGDSRVKLRDAIGLLRNLAPGWEPYQKLTGVRLRDELKLKGVRTINSSGTPYLDPADLRWVRVGDTSIRNSA
jgi:hypothetical protein